MKKRAFAWILLLMLLVTLLPAAVSAADADSVQWVVFFYETK